MRKRGSRGFAGLILLALIVFAFFQLLTPLEANAPVIEGGQEVISSDAKAETKSEDSLLQNIDGTSVDVAILMYHHVAPMPDPKDKIRYNLTVPPDEFESHVKYLKDNNYSFLTLASLNTLIKQNKVPKKAVVMTFDDGYDDNYIYAKPILEKYSATGTFFIISNKVDKPEYVTLEQVKKLSFNHEIGSHSYSHPELVRLSDYYLERELKKSKDELEGIIGRKIVSFCYPAGKYDDKTVEKLAEYGYEIAVTTKPSDGTIDITNLLLAPRYRISPARSLEVLL